MPTRPSLRRRRHRTDVSTWSTTRGEAAPTHLDETTLGYSAVDELAQCDARPLRTSVPADRLPWLYVPLLHAAAGFVSAEAAQTWITHADEGDRWAALTPSPIRSGGPGSPRGGRARQTPISSPPHNVVKPGPGSGDCHQSHELMGRAKSQRRWP